MRLAYWLTEVLGRCSYYEGHSIRDITFYVRLLKLLGVDTLIGGYLIFQGPFEYHVVAKEDIQ